MKRYQVPILLACTLAADFSTAMDAPASAVASQDIAWDSPGADARGSMPIGNGDIGANVRVESNGDLVMLVGKSDSFDEFNRLLKLGRIRIKTTPALFQSGMAFSQTLRLQDGSIGIATDSL